MRGSRSCSENFYIVFVTTHTYPSIPLVFRMLDSGNGLLGCPKYGIVYRHKDGLKCLNSENNRFEMAAEQQCKIFM